MSVSKLERLLKLTAVLLDTTRPLSAEELRLKVGDYPPPGSAFHRAFERDKDELRAVGIPLRVEPVPATDPPLDGYRIYPNDYYLPDVDLQPDELAALRLASLSVRLEGHDEVEAFWKLGSVGLNANSEHDPLGAEADALAVIPNDTCLVPIFQAISEGQAIYFDYNDERRVVDPWRLDFHRGRWYLTGYDHLRSDERNFRLDRIESDVTNTGKSVSVAATTRLRSGPLPAWQLGDGEPIEATLLVDTSRVNVARSYLGTENEVRCLEDGSVVFAIEVVRFAPFRDFVLGFLEHAEILSPQAWRAEMVAWLADIANLETRLEKLD